MVERNQPLFQHMVHTSVEVYFRTPAFTISAGGLRSPPAYSVLGKSKSEAYGAAMPTVIIPTLAGATMKDLFGFAGVGTHEERTDNLCVWFGFACGMKPQMSEIFSSCESNRSSVGATTTVFVNSAACFPYASDLQFFLAARFVDCDGAFCTRGRTWGLMEIVAAPDPDLGNAAAKAARDALYATFRAGRQTAFNATTPDGQGHGVYVTAAGDSISYVLNEAQPIVTAVNGTTQNYDATVGDVIKANRLGLATITAPSGATVEIDFSDWTNPKRSP